ncbi:MAG: arsenate reductase ArsC [Hydrogenobaculum sp.]
MNIAFICVGNSCRSQIAEGYGKYFLKNHNVYSAGLNPQKAIHPLAIEVMKEDGIDISSQYPKSLEDIPLNSLDMYITLCDEEACPNIPNVKHLHWGIKDPAKTNDVNIFREVRDIIKERIKGLLYEIES